MNVKYRLVQKHGREEVWFTVFVNQFKNYLLTILYYEDLEKMYMLLLDFDMEIIIKEM